MGHDRDLDREKDPIRVATLGRWSTLMSWWAFLQGAATGGGALRAPGAPAAEMLDGVDEREPSSRRRTALTLSRPRPDRRTI